MTRARPVLTELVARTGETSGLSVIDGDEVVYLDHVENTNEVTLRDWTGARLPLHVVSSGLVLLAAATARPSPLSRAAAGASRPTAPITQPARIPSAGSRASAATATCGRSASSTTASRRSRHRSSTRTARRSRRSIATARATASRATPMSTPSPRTCRAARKLERAFRSLGFGPRPQPRGAQA